jgi:hypothetical protein
VLLCVSFMPNQARDTADRLSSKLSALLEGRIGANISQLVVAEELSSSESAEKYALEHTKETTQTVGTDFKSRQPDH